MYIINNYPFGSKIKISIIFTFLSSLLKNIYFIMYKYIILFFLCLNYAYSQNNIMLDSTLLTARVVDNSLMIPWEILWGPDDHIWVTERRGRIVRIDPVTKVKKTILNIESRIADAGEGEPGMLGMVLHPNFANSPKVYFVYNYGVAGTIKERLVSWDWNGDTLQNEVTLLDNVPGGNIHDGSRLLITSDNKILMTTGDTGSSNLSQNLGSVNGKILRLNLDGSIPSDNPLPNSYVYSFGHRNPQGLCYGANNSIIYSSEHGAQQSDELNLIKPNRNYGWPNVQGACNTTTEMNFCNANNVVPPLKEWTPCVAVNDLVYYNHPAIPEFKNTLLMAVLGGFVLRPRLSVLSLSPDGLQVTGEKEYLKDLGRIRDICINPHNGAIFIVNNGDSYPGSGPNSLIEYRNLQYLPNSTTNPVSKDNSVKVFPNPVTNNSPVLINLFEDLIGGSIELLSINGNLFQSQKITDRQMTINPKVPSSGVYILKFSNNSTLLYKKLVIH